MFSFRSLYIPIRSSCNPMKSSLNHQFQLGCWRFSDCWMRPVQPSCPWAYAAKLPKCFQLLGNWGIWTHNWHRNWGLGWKPKKLHFLRIIFEPHILIVNLCCYLLVVGQDQQPRPRRLEQHWLPRGGNVAHGGLGSGVGPMIMIQDDSGRFDLMYQWLRNIAKKGFFTQCFTTRNISSLEPLPCACEGVPPTCFIKWLKFNFWRTRAAAAAASDGEAEWMVFPKLICLDRHTGALLENGKPKSKSLKGLNLLKLIRKSESQLSVTQLWNTVDTLWHLVAGNHIGLGSWLGFLSIFIKQLGLWYAHASEETVENQRQYFDNGNAVLPRKSTRCHWKPGGARNLGPPHSQRTHIQVPVRPIINQKTVVRSVSPKFESSVISICRLNSSNAVAYIYIYSIYCIYIYK